MRTRREALKKLPLQKRLQFMEAVRKHCHLKFEKAMNEDIENDSATPMSSCFLFEVSKQGFDYWFNINMEYYEC